MAAVAAKLDPTWPSQPLTIQDDGGLRRRVARQDSLWTLIRDFATPGNVVGSHPYADPSLEHRVRRHFKPHRHKDWWYFGSFGSGILWENFACQEWIVSIYLYL